MSNTYEKNIQLFDKKKALLKHLIQKEAATHLSQRRGASSAARPAIAPRADREHYPLSLAQQRIWMQEQLAPWELVTAILRLAGPLDLAILRQSIHTLLARHEILRAVFTNQHGTPIQTILPVIPVDLSVVDAANLEPDVADPTLTYYNTPHQPHAFDLAHGPLIRTTLVRLASDNHQLILSLHPLLADHATLALLCRELMLIYKHAQAGQKAPLPELTLQYADYAHWQHFHLQGNALKEQKEQENYWHQHLAAAPLTLNLPLDHPRSAVAATRQASSMRILESTLAQQAMAFCVHEELPLDHLLFTVLSLLLTRYTGQTDMVLGFLSTDRTPELEPLAGTFTTILPIHVQCGEGLTGQKFAHDVHNRLLGARWHPQLPLEDIVETVYPQHDLTRTPLFQVSFAFHQLPSFSGLSAHIQSLVSTRGLQDLAFVFQYSDQQLSLTIVSDSDLFDAASIERMHAHYCQLLSSFVKLPMQTLSSFSCLTPGERAQVLHDWNTITPPEPLLSGQCIHQFFEQQVQRTPQAIALSDGSQRLTYQELNCRANQLAHYLRHLGIGPEHLVGLCLTRSLDLVIALLAILKAGAAYVPLDPTYPRDRLVFITQDAHLSLILTQQELLEQMPFSPEQVLCLDTPEVYSRESTENILLVMSNEHLAYAIYTSGSTGRPKGVCVCHRSVSVFLQWARHQFSDEELAGVLVGTSICFDISIFELFAPLSWGGKAILATSILDIAHLAGQERITLLNTVPSAAAALLSSGPLPSSIQTVNLAGEALSRALVQGLYQQTQVQRVCNLYGPTEDTIYSTWTPISAEEQGPVPIGRPLVHTQAYIVDAQMQLVPIGVAGELYLGGEGQARGYLHRPDLTAERFVPDPFSSSAGSRLYKTGDLARYRPDGTIDYLGRLDHQVKVRGFRIELGEIEAHLRQHPALTDVVVVATESNHGEKQLVAYVVASQVCDSSQLRRHLQARVPAYMVPAFFILLDHLPQTPNGKVDRKRLPTPAKAGLNSPGSELPQGEREQWLAHLWQEILHLPAVGQHDNFFLYGGDSLIATRLLACIQRDFQQALSLKDIFAAPTIAQLAEKLQTASIQPDLKPIDAAQDHEVSPDTAFPLSFAQQRIWFVDQLESGVPLYNVPLALALIGPLKRLALYQAIREIVRRHEPLRTTIRVSKGTPFQFISPLATPAFTFVDLALSADTQEDKSATNVDEDPAVLHELQEEVRLPFDLSTGPLLRVRLLRIRDGHHILMLNMHHIITDGWSLGILVEELGLLYSAFSMSRPSPLPPLPIRYTDFVSWQRTHRASRFTADLDYWKARFSPLPPTLALPTDYPRPAVQTFAGDSRSFQISDTLTQQLLALSQQEGATLFMTLLTGFYILLARYCGQEDLVVGTSIANRSHPELEALIGFFVNTLALRADLSGHPTGRELLHRVSEIALNAYQHQEVPFEQVVEAVQPPRDPARSPLFQVLFLLQNLLSTTLDLPDVQAHPIEIAPPTSQFDLSFILEENTAGLRLTIEYNTHLFTSASIERLQAHYQILLSAFCQQPDLRIQEFALLPEEPQGLLIHGEKQIETPFSTSNSLHKPFIEQAERTPTAVAPQDAQQPENSISPKPVEERLAHIWKKVLRLPVVGRNDNFFEIGGHSLLAMQVLSAIREELQSTVTMRQFFAAPTLVEQATLIEYDQAATPPEMDVSVFPPLVPVERTNELPLSFAQQRLWFLDQLDGNNATYTIPIALQLTGPLNLPVLQHCMREIVRRHETLRTTFPTGRHTPIQCIHMLPLVPIDLVEFSEHDPIEKQAAIAQELQRELQRPFDLATGPLLRLRILRVSQQQHILLFTMHHIISDGWSMGILAHELTALYNAFLAGKPSPLSELPIQYVDFVAWQRTYLQGARLTTHLAYWKQQLAGAPTLQLPTDHPRTPVPSSPGASCSVQWPLPITQQLQTFSQQEDVTLFMTLLTGLLVLLAYESKQEDITIGTPIANRPHPALESLVGLFVNTLALRNSLAGNPTGYELLRRVRDVTLDAYDHQDVAFDQVVEAVHPQRQPGISPLFQVMFVLQSNAVANVSLHDIEVQPLELHTATAKFDLSVGAALNTQGMDIGIEYNTQLFERTTIQRFLAHYRTLLTHLITHPEHTLADLYEVVSCSKD